MASLAFTTAERAMRVKRRNFSKEIAAILDEVKSEASLSKESFDEKKVYFEQHWDEIVTSTEGCINLFDDGDDDKDEHVNELNYQIELLKMQKEQFFSLRNVQW